MSDQRIIKPAHGPEWYIQRDFVKYLRARGWLVERMIGNAFQQGIPDLFCWHRKYGTRWVDLKRPKGGTLTKAQQHKWPVWEANGLGIWIVTTADQAGYDKLFAPPNWREWWKAKYETKNIDDLIEELYGNETTD